MAVTDPFPDAASLAFLEERFGEYLRDPAAVPENLRGWFDRFRDESSGEVPTGPSFRPSSLFNPAGGSGNGRAVLRNVAALQDRVDQLIRAYRVRGHLIAKLDPLGRPRAHCVELDPGFYDFDDSDLDLRFSTRTVHGTGRRTLREILQVLRNTYCRSIGVQFMHIDDLELKSWLTDRMEGTENRIHLGRREQLRILRRLSDAVLFEEFVRKKFLGAKSFSLEGAESLIPLLDLTIEKAVDAGVRQVGLGMAHRGRLNVLRNILHKGPREIFREFDDPDPERWIGHGDVKYHKGWDSEWVTANGNAAQVSMCFNPSHLEFVDPVAIGRMRARLDLRRLAPHQGLTLLIHGDAAFAGEGVVQETLNLSQLPAYSVGGTLHVVLNNQIGFTTCPEQSRSTTYATDVAKMLQIPIFHVNGEDPEAVAQVVSLAVEFRQTFARDVVIDMYGYRRLGHNEGDEPAFTQPLMYGEIRRRKTTRQGYLDHLLELGEVGMPEADEIAARIQKLFEKELEASRSAHYEPPAEAPRLGAWTGYFGGPEKFAEDAETTFDRDRLAGLLRDLTRLPEGFRPHAKITRWLDQRTEQAAGDRPIDWSAAEALALATLAVEGHRVRMTGQDSERGTFSHRHAVLHDAATGAKHCALQHLAPDQAPVEIHNSALSEVGVLGFEYGYSLEYPDGLVVWEAQFGDFANAAQVIIDQFITSGEDKWKWFSGLTLLLPHGFEGMGPEHSSARLERWLQLAAEDNIQVVNLTTPAQLFHALRRQVLRPWRKPLVVMSPKSLLRHPKVASSLDDLASGEFHRILPDALSGPDEDREGPVDRVLLCSGKIYYDLSARREEQGRSDVAILRLEQIYPLADRVFAEALAPYPEGTPVHWVQEEPENMGAWRHLHSTVFERFRDRYPITGISREASASPATGSASSHRQEQEAILARSFG